MINKLQLKCLATDRPAANDTTDYAFFYRSGPDERLKFSCTYKGTSWYAQDKSDTDTNRFYTTLEDAARFLDDNELIEVPQDQARLVHTKANDFWLYHKVRDAVMGDAAYDDIRKAFIKQRVEAQGVEFSTDLYDAL